MDATLIASECVDTRTRSEVLTDGLMCKLDIEKTFDLVNCDYHLNILNQMGFGDRWLKWINLCTKFVIMENLLVFSLLKGASALRQGDPLVPFLFILAMEGLSSVVNTTLQNIG
uniref:Putative ovule protein n=1 Tax=Solanum chacoense TaxID=4108 RepID=A0A0V0HIC7_SOLCH